MDEFLAVMQRSSASPETSASTAITARRVDGAPLYTYSREPGVPPVSVISFPGEDWPIEAVPGDHAHAHDFLVLVYFEIGGGSLRIGGKVWTVRAGDVFVIAPGEVVAVGDGAGLTRARGSVVFFPARALAPEGQGAFLLWRSHPLLFPFIAGAAAGAHRLNVPRTERPRWSARIAEIQDELRARRQGFEDAVTAQLTLLLIAISRLGADVGEHLRLSDEPLLAAMFEIIEEQYLMGISLADVAGALGLTPGHLTTAVRRKTGRTVQQWINERRMTQARSLLSETDLTVEVIGRQAGFRSSSYFIKQFRREHGVTPLDWRRARRLRP